MRPDMAKVITERPRVHGMGRLAQKGYKKELQQYGLDFVKRESIKELRGGSKDFTDVLGPIKGFLKSRVDKPWNSVHSEISKALPATGGVSYSHARDQLFQMVELHTQIINGELCNSERKPLLNGYPEFYVDPKGFLRHNRRKRHRYVQKKKVFARTEDGEWLIEDEHGIWWACKMQKMYRFKRKHTNKHLARNGYMETVYETVYDHVHKESTDNPRLLVEWYGEEVYAGNRPNPRQLGKREIKKYKLREKAK